MKTFAIALMAVFMFGCGAVTTSSDIRNARMVTRQYKKDYATCTKEARQYSRPVGGNAVWAIISLNNQIDSYTRICMEGKGY